MKLIEQVQQQVQPKGVEFDALRQAWQQAGAPKVPEQVYQLLTKTVGKQVALDAFKEIGISFQKHAAGAASVLDKKVANQLAKYAKTLSPDRLRQLIKTIEGGQKKQQGAQQQAANKPQTPTQVQGQQQQQNTQAAKTQPRQTSTQGQINPQGPMTGQPQS